MTKVTLQAKTPYSHPGDFPVGITGFLHRPTVSGVPFLRGLAQKQFIVPHILKNCKGFLLRTHECVVSFCLEETGCNAAGLFFNSFQRLVSSEAVLGLGEDRFVRQGGAAQAYFVYVKPRTAH